MCISQSKQINDRLINTLIEHPSNNLIHNHNKSFITMLLILKHNARKHEEINREEFWGIPERILGKF